MTAYDRLGHLHTALEDRELVGGWKSGKAGKGRAFSFMSSPTDRPLVYWLTHLVDVDFEGAVERTFFAVSLSIRCIS